MESFVSGGFEAKETCMDYMESRMVITAHFVFSFCLIYKLRYRQVVGHFNVTTVTV